MRNLVSRSDHFLGRRLDDLVSVLLSLQPSFTGARRVSLFWSARPDDGSASPTSSGEFIINSGGRRSDMLWGAAKIFRTPLKVDVLAFPGERSKSMDGRSAALLGGSCKPVTIAGSKGNRRVARCSSFCAVSGRYLYVSSSPPEPSLSSRGRFDSGLSIRSERCWCGERSITARLMNEGSCAASR